MKRNKTNREYSAPNLRTVDDTGSSNTPMDIDDVEISAVKLCIKLEPEPVVSNTSLANEVKPIKLEHYQDSNKMPPNNKTTDIEAQQVLLFNLLRHRLALISIDKHMSNPLSEDETKLPEKRVHHMKG